MPPGERIRELRIKAGITQKDLADRMGLPRQQINVWETGVRTPKIENLKRVADALGINGEEYLYLLGV